MRAVKEDARDLKRASHWRQAMLSSSHKAPEIYMKKKNRKVQNHYSQLPI